MKIKKFIPLLSTAAVISTVTPLVACTTQYGHNGQSSNDATVVIDVLKPFSTDGWKTYDGPIDSDHQANNLFGKACIEDNTVFQHDILWGASATKAYIETIFTNISFDKYQFDLSGFKCEHKMNQYFYTFKLVADVSLKLTVTSGYMSVMNCKATLDMNCFPLNNDFLPFSGKRGMCVVPIDVVDFKYYSQFFDNMYCDLDIVMTTETRTPENVTINKSSQDLKVTQNSENPDVIRFLEEQYDNLEVAATMTLWWESFYLNKN